MGNLWKLGIGAAAVLCAVFLTYALGSAREAKPASPPQGYRAVEIASLVVEGEAVSLTVRDEKGLRGVVVEGIGLRAAVKRFREGDRVLVAGEDRRDGSSVLSDILPRTVAIPRTVRILCFAGWGLFVLLAALAFLRSEAHVLLVGKDHYLSNSKFQVAAWTWALLTGYLAFVSLRCCAGGCSLLGGVATPANLLLLSGLSAFTFAGAKGIRVAKEGEKTEETRNREATAAANRPLEVGDLFKDNRSKVDIGDFQMVAVTGLAVAVFAGRVLCDLQSVPLMKEVSLPDVDSTILATFGLGQGAYLMKKYVGDGHA